VYLLRGVVRPIRQVSEAAKRVRRGDLDVRVAETGRGEVGRLGASFNEMASSIQNRDEQLSQAKRQLELAVTAAEEASVLKSNFLANMSHEIRTPLNGVVGMISLLGETSLTQEQREYVEVARSSSDALMSVVSDVLDVAKIEAGRLQVENREFDLHEVVEASCEMVAASALTKGVELQSYVHEDVPRAVIGDRTRVGQILVNLLANAVKFTAEGEVALEVGVAARGVRLTTVQFEVRDTGIGIDPARIKQLFEPFAQADATTTRRFGGTGLGLAISLELARLMGGGIQAQSKVGTGSSFRVRIPFALARSQLRTPVPPTRLRGLRVLVVDDSATNRRVFEAYLTSWEMRSEGAVDAAEAYERLQSAAQQGDPFHLVLLDLNMPGESGIELASRIRRAATLRWTRVILLTSSPSADADDPEAGIDAQLTKPVRQSRLLDTVSAVMAYDPAAPNASTTASSLLTTSNPALSEANGSPAAIGRRILVAEDQPVNWMLIERLLQKRGHRAVHATDGRQALEILAAEDFDLVLMDCQMPELDGYQVAREIRQREVQAGQARLPVVAMTAHALQGDRQRCIDAGMDDYMAKPISAGVLDRVLTRWLAVSSRGGAELSRDRVEELRSLFPGSEFGRMLRDVAAEIEADLEQIAAAVDGDDLATVAAAAHRLKGSARVADGVDRDQLCVECYCARRRELVRSGDTVGVSNEVVGLVAQGSGAIVNISSLGAVEPSLRFPVSSALRAGLRAARGTSSAVLADPSLQLWWSRPGPGVVPCVRNGSRWRRSPDGQAIAFLFITMMFYSLYKFLPNRHIRWQTALIASLLPSFMFELAKRRVTPAPSESAVYRALVRAAVIDPAVRDRRSRKGKRWERGAPMELWQMDVVSGSATAATRT